MRFKVIVIAWRRWRWRRRARRQAAVGDDIGDRIRVAQQVGLSVTDVADVDWSSGQAIVLSARGLIAVTDVVIIIITMDKLDKLASVRLCEKTGHEGGIQLLLLHCQILDEVELVTIGNGCSDTWRSGNVTIM